MKSPFTGGPAELKKYRNMRHNFKKTLSMRMDRLFEQAKLAVASRLHDAFPARYCWADCVAYSVSSERVSPFRIDGCQGCKAESIEQGACYCGAWCNGATWSSMSEAERDEAGGKADTGATLFD